MICRCDLAGLLVASAAALVLPGSGGPEEAVPVPASAGGAENAVPVPDWASYVRVGRYEPKGIACRTMPSADAEVAATFYFKQPLYAVDRTSGWTSVRPSHCVGSPSTENGDEKGCQPCFLRAEDVSPVHTRPFVCPKPDRPTPLAAVNALLGAEPPDTASGVSVGPLFPTFYQVAREQIYPSEEGEAAKTLKDRKGNTIADVSPPFLRALLIQGTGMLMDGRIVNVAGDVEGEHRFVALPKGSWGLGINKIPLVPYRSVAVDFDTLCDRLRGAGCSTAPEAEGAALGAGAGGAAAGAASKRDRKTTRANRKALAGMLLYVPRLVGAKMADGTEHDGYVCAVDVGGGIRGDRIDIFVGTDGAGNPYYPPCRRDNPFIRHGVQSLIPSDWHTFLINAKGDYERSIPGEYRTVAASKGLEIFAFPEVKCSGAAKPK